MTDALPVAVLARAGVARDQLERALAELGARVVVVADPNDLAPGAVLDSGARAVLVAVEPAVERALERLESDLWAPGINVLFDDAQLGGARSGWDEARWARHIAAKLLGRDVLPNPATESAALPDAGVMLTPGAPPSPAALVEHPPIAQLEAESQSLSDAIPSGFTPPDASTVPESVPTVALPRAPLVDDDELARALSAIQAADAAPPQRLPSIEHSGDSLELVDLSADDLAAFADIEHRSLDSLDRRAKDDGLDPFSFKPVDNSPYSRTSGDSDAAIRQFQVDLDAPVRFSGLAAEDHGTGPLELDADLAALAASLDSAAEAVPEPVREAVPAFDAHLSLVDEVQPPAAPAQPPRPASPPALSADFDIADDRPKTKLDFGNLSLVDADVPAMPPPAEVKKAAARDFTRLGSGLQLEGEEPPPAPRKPEPGLVVILAGMGGPDAVRQLLKAMPAGLTVPVLLLQQLEGGRYERLAEQLGKVSVLPVKVPGPHTLMAAAEVYVVPDGIGVEAARGAFHDGGNAAALIGEVPPADLLAVVVSGADPAVIPALKLARAQGAQVLVQTLEGCFEPSVAKALAADGAPALPPDRLAQAIADRFLK